METVTSKWNWTSLRQKLLLMASHAETAVNQAVQALVQRDHDLAVQRQG